MNKSESTQKSYSHHAYLLRCWQEGDTGTGGNLHWRFVVEEVLHERRSKGFSSLEEVMAFLQDALSASEDAPARHHL